MIKRLLITVTFAFMLTAIAYAAVEDYLILQDIGPYKLFTGIEGRAFSGSPRKCSQTNTGGVLQVVGHFSENDVSYDASYTVPSSKWPLVEVEVTQHSGSDSDKWLLHEVENAYRDGDDSDGKLGLLSGAGIKIRDIGGNKFIYWGLGGGNYTWISGQKVVEIKYTDLQRTKPEPIEVVQVYLQKHPSSISSTLVLDKVHDAQWIKDELDRRLWLCDKWSAHLAAGKTDAKTAFEAIIKSMNVFLDYREKYYGVKAMDEKNLLAGYLAQSNGAAIQAKLTEYKSWWNANKSGTITLP